MTSRRAVAPVIATLLLVAIAVVGGSIIFVFSQGFFSSAQISGSPQIESIKILGYDATDGNATQWHDGFVTNSTLTGANAADGLNAEEYVVVYLKNDSVNKITLSEILLAGEEFIYIDQGGIDLPNYSTGLGTLGDPQYTIVEEGFDGANHSITIDSSAPELQPGQHLTMILALDKDFVLGHDLQFLMTTTNGTQFVETIIMGNQIV